MPSSPMLSRRGLSMMPNCTADDPNTPRVFRLETVQQEKATFTIVIDHLSACPAQDQHAWREMAKMTIQGRGELPCARQSHSLPRVHAR